MRPKTMEMREAEIAGIARRRLLKRISWCSFHPPLLPVDGAAAARAAPGPDAMIPAHACQLLLNIGK